MRMFLLLLTLFAGQAHLTRAAGIDMLSDAEEARRERIEKVHAKKRSRVLLLLNQQESDVQKIEMNKRLSSAEKKTELRKTRRSYRLKLKALDSEFNPDLEQAARRVNK